MWVRNWCLAITWSAGGFHTSNGSGQGVEEVVRATGRRVKRPASCFAGRNCGVEYLSKSPECKSCWQGFLLQEDPQLFGPLSAEKARAGLAFLFLEVVSEGRNVVIQLLGAVSESFCACAAGTFLSHGQCQAQMSVRAAQLFRPKILLRLDLLVVGYPIWFHADSFNL